MPCGGDDGEILNTEAINHTTYMGFKTDKEDTKDTILDTSYTQWSHGGNGVYYPVGVTQPTLLPGVYIPTENQSGQLLFVKQDIKVDNLLELPDDLSTEILKEVATFWERGDLFKNFGFLHRRGMLMVGPPGGGKSSLIQQVLAKLIKSGGIAFTCKSPSSLSRGLQAFRQIEPDRPVVCIFEDLDAIIRSYGEEVILQVLDGESQIDKVLNVGTTNYPEQLDGRLTSRPRRFDRVFEISYPNDKIRRFYFENKLKITGDELEEWVENSDGFSFAAMAELVIAVKCLGHNFKKSVEVLSNLMQNKVSSSNFKKNSLGFSSR